MILFNTVAELRQSSLVRGDVVTLLGDKEPVDGAVMVGIVRDIGFTSPVNRTEVLANGLVVELLPKSDKEIQGQGGIKRDFFVTLTAESNKVITDIFPEAVDVWVDNVFVYPEEYTVDTETKTITFKKTYPIGSKIYVAIYTVKSIALGVTFKGSASLEEILAVTDPSVGDIWISDTEGTILDPQGNQHFVTVNEGLVWTYSNNQNFLGWLSIGLLRGPKGNPGEQGGVGPQGQQGQQGQQGIQGNAGIEGPQGAIGPQGIQGEEGPIGDRGPQGDVGPRPNHRFVGTSIQFEQHDGTWGPLVDIKGPQGVQGPQGNVGLTGPQGKTGPQGAQGIQGIQGPRGYKGDTGEQGLKGDKGDTGPTGAQGIQGELGLSPEHEWSGSSLRFRQQNGAWGNYVDLRGIQGVLGPIGPMGPAGQDGLNFKLQGYAPLSEIILKPSPNIGDMWISTTQGTLGGKPVIIDDNIVYSGTSGWVNIGPFKGEQGPIGPVGPKGPQGDQGIRGPEGQQGVRGDMGPKGPQGEIGPQGLKGDKGLTGDKGPKGDKGDAGDQGAEGPVGPIGPEGPQGLQGETGLRGPQGLQGIDGKQGPQGPKGDKGLTGDVGPRGPQGLIGPQGPDGEQGLKGVQGEKGIQGEEGPPGPRGPQGNQGIQGPTGQQGPRGLPGEKGETGDKGATGAQGPTGAAGPDGERGSREWYEAVDVDVWNDALVTQVLPKPVNHDVFIQYNSALGYSESKSYMDGTWSQVNYVENFVLKIFNGVQVVKFDVGGKTITGTGSIGAATWDNPTLRKVSGWEIPMNSSALTVKGTVPISLDVNVNRGTRRTDNYPGARIIVRVDGATIYTSNWKEIKVSVPARDGGLTSYFFRQAMNPTINASIGITTVGLARRNVEVFVETRYRSGGANLKDLENNLSNGSLPWSAVYYGEA